MPQNEPYWNPYRWVPVSDQPVMRHAPVYQHRLEGLAGRLTLELEALTPLLIGDGKGNFIAHQPSKPFIPGTSLKGAIRSLVELIGNAAVPFPNVDVDMGHQQTNQATASTGGPWQLDIAARMFGYMGRGANARNFAGLVRFSDAPLIEGTAPSRGLWESYRVSGGQPKATHTAFYPTRKARKFYHHRAGAKELLQQTAGIRPDQIRSVRPAPVGARFAFVVDFFNLTEEEFCLLLYCLVLEESVEVTLSPAALGRHDHTSITLHGPMRHKLGGCKPQGAGSCHLHLQRIQLRSNPADRYRGRGPVSEVIEGSHLNTRLTAWIRPYVKRQDDLMRSLRAMLIYTEEDPRAKHLEYPSYAWFQEEKHSATKTPLKPTL